MKSYNSTAQTTPEIPIYNITTDPVAESVTLPVEQLSYFIKIAITPIPTSARPKAK